MPVGTVPLTQVTPAARIGTHATQPEGGRADRWEVGGCTTDGHLLLSYGDYGPNTGPIDVIGYRPSDDDQRVLLAGTPTEELWRFRPDEDGAAWAASIDPVYPPRGSDEGFVVTNEGGTWRVITTRAVGKGKAIHSFDVLPPTATDPNIYVCGARDVMLGEGPNQDGNSSAVAFIMRSSNGGATWTEVVHDQSNTEGGHRFYGMARIGDRIIACASYPGQDGTGDQEPTWGYWHGNGDTWTRVPAASGAPGVLFPPVLGETTFAGGGHIWAWDDGLVEVTEDYAPGLGMPLVVDGDDYLYADTLGKLWRTGQAEPIGQLPGGDYNNWRGVRSLADGEVYLSNRANIYLLGAVTIDHPEGDAGLTLTELVASVDIDPAIAAQPTPTGQSIVISGPTGDELLVAYGDEGPNTGPIDVLTYNPVTEVTTNRLNDTRTERITKYRQFDDGSWWGCSIDPKLSEPGFLITNRGGTWHTVTVDIPALTVMVHIHDCAEVDGVLYACGSRDILVSEGGRDPAWEDEGMAVVWKSEDDGDTWTEILARVADGLSQFNRFYHFGRVGDALLVSTQQIGDPALYPIGYYVIRDGEASDLIPGPTFSDFNHLAQAMWGDGCFYTGDGKFTLYANDLLVPLPFLPNPGGLMTPLVLLDEGRVIYSRSAYPGMAAGTYDTTLGKISSQAMSSGVAMDDGTIYLSNGSAVYRLDA